MTQNSPYSEAHAALSQEVWLTINIDGEIVAPNVQLKTVLGWGVEHQERRSIRHYVARTDLALVGEALLLTFMRPDQVIERTNRFCHADGGERWLTWRARAQSTDDAVMVLRDASSVEEHLAIYRETSKNLRRLEDLASDPVLRYDRKGMLQTANAAARAMLGISERGELPWSRLVDLFDVREHKRVYQQVLPDLHSRGATFTHIHITTPLGGFPADVAVLHDRVPPESYLVWIRDTSVLRPVAALHRDLAAIVSHELRTPLAVARTSLALLRANQPDIDRLNRRLFDTMDASLIHLRKLTDDILDLEAVATGQHESVLEELDPNHIARLAVTMMAPIVATTGIRVTVVEADPIPRMFADEGSLARVLVNLMDNAIRHSYAGGHVTLRVDSEIDGETLFSIADHGPGIPPDQRGRIFDRFVRLPGGPKYRGSGLGLAIVASIVHQHSGHIEVIDTPGGGATFRVMIPAVHDDIRHETTIFSGSDDAEG